MTTEFTLPDLGEGLPDAELVRWLVAEGDAVALNQPLAEVETAKAIVELPSPYAGTVRALHATDGETVDVGAVIVSFELEGEGRAEPEDVDSEPVDETGDADASPVPNLVGYGAAVTSGRRPRRRARARIARPAPVPAGSDARAEVDVLERPRATPPVRAYARSRGVALDDLAGTGPGGRIEREDVDREASAPPGEPEPSAPPAGDRITPVRGVRKHTAQAMVDSAFTAPHVTVFHTVDVTRSVALVAALRNDRRDDTRTDAPIGLTAIVAKAVCLALGRHPGLNAAFRESGEGEGADAEIVEYGRIDLGIAAATERGLIVPVVRGAGGMALPALAHALAELTATARAGRTAPADLRGATFTISNVGVFGIEAGTPILGPEQAGILAVGTVQRRPWEHEGGIALRDVMTLSLSFDHRVVDGEQGARFLVDVADLLNEPARAMVFA